MTKNLLSIFGLIAFLSAEPAAAADICEAKVLVTVRADEDPSSLLRAGTTNTAITQLRKDKQTGRTSFCSHGGYCYPTHALSEESWWSPNSSQIVQSTLRVLASSTTAKSSITSPC